MVLVTGGTGLVGAHILLKLSQKNQKIIALFRHEATLASVQSFFESHAADGVNAFEQIQWVCADVNDASTIDALMQGVQEVYHCAAKVSFARFQREKMMHTNIQGTANLVNAALKNGVKKFGFVSSIAAIGDEETLSVVNEENPWNNGISHTDYAYSKHGAELEVWRGSQEGLPVIIINPGVILGAHFWNRSSAALFDRVAKGLAFYPTGSAAVVDVKDVVDVFIRLMASEIQNQRFILVAKNLTQKELLTKIAVSLGKKPPAFPLHKTYLYFLFVLDQIARLFYIKKPFLDLTFIKTLCSNQEFDGSKIQKHIPFDYHDIDDGIQKIGLEYPQKN
jgi:dihydroflavonol-4-reductase